MFDDSRKLRVVEFFHRVIQRPKIGTNKSVQPVRPAQLHRQWPAAGGQVWLDPGTRQQPAPIIMLALRTTEKWDHGICDQQIPPTHGEFVSRVSERRAFAHLLIQPDPVFPTASVDFSQAARYLEGSSLASQTNDMRGSPGRSVTAEGPSFIYREFAGYTDRFFAPMFAPIGEAVSLAEMIDCQSPGLHRNFCARGGTLRHAPASREHFGKLRSIFAPWSTTDSAPKQYRPAARQLQPSSCTLR